MQHEIKGAELLEFSKVHRFKEFKTIYVRFKYQGTDNWFMITEHDDCPSRLQNIKRFGVSFNIGHTFDFRLEIKTSENKSNKLKIKSITLK